MTMVHVSLKLYFLLPAHTNIMNANLEFIHSFSILFKITKRHSDITHGGIETNFQFANLCVRLYSYSKYAAQETFRISCQRSVHTVHIKTSECFTGNSFAYVMRKKNVFHKSKCVREFQWLWKVIIKPTSLFCTDTIYSKT